jgi:hypothetical protein
MPKATTGQRNQALKESPDLELQKRQVALENRLSSQTMKTKDQVPK